MKRLFLGCCKAGSSSVFSVPIAEVLKRIYKLVGDPRSTALEENMRSRALEENCRSTG